MFFARRGMIVEESQLLNISEKSIYCLRSKETLFRGIEGQEKYVVHIRADYVRYRELQ